MLRRNQNIRQQRINQVKAALVGGLAYALVAYVIAYSFLGGF